MGLDETTTDAMPEAMPTDPDDRGADRAAGGLDARAMLAVVRAAGYEPSPILRRREDHVEILASRDGHAFALQLDLDGRVRQVMPMARAPTTEGGA